MEQFFSDHRALLRMHKGPLGVYVDSFARQLSDQGYGRPSARLQIRLVADFSRWLQRRGVSVREITPEHANRYLQYRAHHRRPVRGDVAALRRLLDVLRRSGAIAENSAPIQRTPTQEFQQEFATYLPQERGLAPMTVTAYVRLVGRFLADRFGDGEVQLSVLCAADVTRYVQRQAACHRFKWAKLMTTALRSFLRYARYRGYINTDLIACVPTVANWSVTSLPRSLPPAQVQQILSHCDRQTAMGRRDFAILLLLARLGLRAGEVASLRLENIDWEAGCLSIDGKGRHWCQLPLPIDVGEAIAVYLRDGRPQGGARALFLRGHAPFVGFAGHETVASVVRRAMARAGIDSIRKGAHQFRHTLACQMLRQGASLAEIGELLRHRSRKTTSIYARVDFAALRPLALPWPGGAR